ncbi:DUF6308 family protein [Mobilicoccus massiliensis]|uniref:DUF6308 family protein n=1 Tax=Mobilicoccus massiliensis TaxID=1522310 RepID=UPI00069360D2|nr:DUF6308 family protein [Mobilicoccus massiliensis]
MPEFTLPVPSDWRRAEPFYAGALDRALTVLRDPRTPERLARYYDRRSNYAGATFTQLADDAPTRVTDRDLLAVSLLDVTVPPATVRALLDDGEMMERVESLLSEDRLPLDARLENVTPELLAAMDELYVTLRSLVPPARDRYAVNWVTAAKLCARKRPDLFPVRDEVVCRYLGTWPSRYQIDWQVFARIIGDEEVRERLQRLIDRVSESEAVDVGDPCHLLRHLDVCIWMHAPHGH